MLWRNESYRADYEALVDEVQRQDVGLMTIKAVSIVIGPKAGYIHTPPGTSPTPIRERITAAVLWALSHREVTGIATAGDVGLLGMMVPGRADQDLRQPRQRDN